jgi:hypothetical protein
MFTTPSIYLRALLAIIFLLLISCDKPTSDNIPMSENNTKFEWDATESAPKHYPMEIIRGTFIYRGEKELGLYIPSGGTLRDGWGEFVSSHVTGERYKPLPYRLKITFFSYGEKQFYQGEFELPYEEILALFREGVAADPDDPTVNSIMAGIAPGGVVAVWVIGSGDYKEVFFGQAEKIELDPSRAFGLPFKDKAESDAYIAKQLVNSLTPEEIESLNKNGIPFDLWSRYRNRYAWAPVIKGGHSRDYVNVIYFNGENERRWRDFGRIDSNELRTVPKRLSFGAIVNGKKTLFQVSFEEFETLAAFEQLAANGEKLYLEFEPKWPRSQTRVRLHNGKESSELVKAVSKDW